MAILLKGAPVAKEICGEAARRAEKLRERGIAPALAIVRVGENDADIYYERAAMRRCDAAGIDVRNVILRESVTQQELICAIRELNEDREVSGVLIFRPLPAHISDEAVRGALDPKKDVDGITEASLGGIFTGSGTGFCPCTAESVMEILRYYGVELEGRRACVIGRSLVIGKPVSQLLMAKNATVTVCHTRTRDLKEETRRADIIVSAAGRAGTVTIGNVTPGQVIVDVGINTDADGGLCGDVVFSDVEPFVNAITPVPGGVGAVTTAVLCMHVIEAAEGKK